MPLIEAALAFAITMLALSLVCSSLVEVVHRTLKLRESGLQYMLGQLFDQVLSKYLAPLVTSKLADPAYVKRLAALKKMQVADVTSMHVMDTLRNAFIERMTANRVPVGLPPDPTLVSKPSENATKPSLRLGNLWGGRRVTELSLVDFMERLGSAEVGMEIKAEVEAAAAAAGGKAADAVDLVLKDIAQKFEGFGKDAGVYFQGRARMMSVAIAIVLAFVVHVDAVDLFKTYLRDPNARAKVIEQAQAVTAQYKASADAAQALANLAKENVTPPPDAKEQVEQLKRTWNDALSHVTTTATQFSDLGAPLGWTPERIRDAGMYILVWSCLNKETKESEGFGKLMHACAADDPGYKGAQGTQYKDIWFGVPTVPRAWLYLVLGGLLIGLGSPFWYDVVVNLTNLRGATRAPTTPAVQAAAPNDRPQPITPVGAFQVSNKAAQLAR
ncbi:hypothetical protein CVM73_35865 [Bradyrhizobium forestalis]|uniref:Uncharacterized protein n=2 Tax=Bradyrhizobium forestalis TaxID=1419263 RepID=A0A2M8QY43_9BRAD|nr:hypothetical protein CVM73_35865 [Bradyrhizobium forestalis]